MQSHVDCDDVHYVHNFNIEIVKDKLSNQYLNL